MLAVVTIQATVQFCSQQPGLSLDSLLRLCLQTSMQEGTQRLCLRTSRSQRRAFTLLSLFTTSSLAASRATITTAISRSPTRRAHRTRVSALKAPALEFSLIRSLSQRLLRQAQHQQVNCVLHQRAVRL